MPQDYQSLMRERELWANIDLSDCPRCEGIGKIFDEESGRELTCPTCRGSGNDYNDWDELDTIPLPLRPC